jgi:hypothetical protein
VSGQIRAELAKIRSTRTWIVLLVVMLGYVLLNTIVLLFVDLLAENGGGDVPGAPSIANEQGVRNVWASAGGGYVITLILGVLIITTEYRHRTLTSTFLAQPHRLRVVVAKLAAAAGASFAFAALAAAAVAAVAVPILAARDAYALPAADVAAILAGGILGSTLFGVLGVGVGTLVRNQVAAIVGGLVWLLLGEALLIAFLPSVGKWLPGGAANSLVQATSFQGDALLSPGLAAVVLAGYTAVLVGIAAATTLRRDVT